MKSKNIFAIALVFSAFLFSCSSEDDNKEDLANNDKQKEIVLPVNKPKTEDNTPKFKEGDRKITSEGLERTFLLRVPNNYKSETPMPLVVALHGYTGSGKAMEGNSQFTKLGEKEGFISVYPDGIKDAKGNRNWAIRGPGKTVDGKDFDDIIFIDDILDLLKKELSIDTKRIYITGFSNGGFMSYRFAFLRSTVFAAVATNGAFSLKSTSDFKPERAIPIMHMHGLEDKIIPPSGVISPTSPYLYAQPSVDQWVALNGASDMPTVVKDDANVKIREWKSVTENSADVIYVEVKKGTHQWFNKSNTGGFDATVLIWDFFKAHPKEESKSI